MKWHSFVNVISIEIRLNEHIDPNNHPDYPY